MNLRAAIRIARGALGITVTWSVLWAAVGVALRVIAPEEPISPTLAILVATARSWAIFGGIGGLVFATFLAVSGRRRIGELSITRTAFWGAVASVVVPLSLGVGGELRAGAGIATWVIRLCAQFAMVGGLSAAATLALARRAQSNPTLPPDRDALSVSGDGMTYAHDDRPVTSAPIVTQRDERPRAAA